MDSYKRSSQQTRNNALPLLLVLLLGLSIPIAMISPVKGEKPIPSFTALISSSVCAYLRRYSLEMSSNSSKSFPVVSISMIIFLDIAVFLPRLHIKLQEAAHQPKKCTSNNKEL
jgi:hypothetical protein